MASTAEQMRRYQGLALFSFGFRPFFLFGAILASALPTLTALSMSGASSFGGAYGAIAYHGHEMVFGFLGAIVAGFLLTAAPNWTGGLPVIGWRLGGMFALWLAGRAAIAASAVIGMGAASVIDGLFLIALDLVIWREVTAGKSWRNIPVCVLVGFFAIGNLIWHFRAISEGAGQFGLRWGVAVIAILIALIGGRITPSFTRNWLMKTGRPAASAAVDTLDKAALGVAGAALVFWLVNPVGVPTGVLLFAASALHLARLARWRGWRTLAEPLVTILHVGYFWLALSFALIAASAAFPAQTPPSAAFHALTSGAAGVMILAVMTRATRGHTGRPLAADAVTLVIYGLVNLGALARVLAHLAPDDYAAALLIASTLWSGAFLLFAIVYGRYLFGAKLS